MLSCNLEENINQIKSILPIGESFDIVARKFTIGETAAYFIGINGMYDSQVMQMILTNLQNPTFIENKNIVELSQFISSKIGFSQTETSSDMAKIIKSIVSGPSVIIIDGFSQGIIIDLREYPVRSIAEPENEKVMKGAKDGFVETLLFNANLIRRRIRNPTLTFFITNVGQDSQTDVAVAYVASIAHPKLVAAVKNAVEQIKVRALTMGEKSLEELLVKKRWFNPMPSLRTTERPDVACSYLLEGNVLILVDNTPMVIILPGTIFQFTQSPEDYYKNPVTGNLFRFLRVSSMFISLYLLPFFAAVAGHMPKLSAVLSFSDESQIGPIRLMFYALFAEFALDFLQYAATHVLNTLITPLSIVGGLIIGEIAISLEWFSKEVIFYGAVTLLTTLIISHHEFADALRIYRLILVVFAGFFGLWGLVVGSLLIGASVLTTPTFDNQSYFYPLIPFKWSKLKTLLFRLSTSKVQQSEDNLKK